MRDINKVVCQEKWQKGVLTQEAKLEQVIRNMNASSLQIVFILDKFGKIFGTLSDGDVRRAMLRGFTLESPIENIIRKNPIVVREHAARSQVIELMIVKKVQQIPIVDHEGKMIGLHLWDEVAAPPHRVNPIVIMAGGQGKRLRPHTNACPKAMLEVAGKPMIQHIIERAREEGFNRFVLSINYLGHMIEEYFGNGEFLNVRIEYLKEKEALGTAGALSLFEPIPETPFLVTNCDIMTELSFGAMLDFHVTHKASATMAVRSHEWQHPFGVINTDGINIIGLEEKPITRSNINAGVYILDPKVLKKISASRMFDMTDLFEKLLKDKQTIIAYPMHESWLDVGRPSDLDKANADKGS